MACNLIVMIADGLGYNGWLASDYFWHGQAAPHRYQQPQTSTPWLHRAMSTGSLRFIDARGRPVATDGSALPDNAMGHQFQDYHPDQRWNRFEGSFYHDFSPFWVPYASYTDSAAAATALFSGRVTTDVRLNMNWDASQRHTTIAELAKRAGLGAGVVTSVQSCHATPAGTMAHNPYRNNLEAIFQELVASPLDVLCGAGHPAYDNSGQPRPAHYGYVGGRDCWRQLIQGQTPWRWRETRGDLETIASGVRVPERLVGIPRVSDTLQANRSGFPKDANQPSGRAANPAVPSLATLSEAALTVLGQYDAGFFLLVEGGAVDWKNHNHDFPRMLEEHRDFNEAVAAVIAWVEHHSSWEETTLVVTADHECGGLWGEGSFIPHDREVGFHPERTPFQDFVVPENRGQGEIPAVQYATVHHTNELVPLWAMGAGAMAFATHTVGHDAFAQRLWGEPYGWNGDYVHTTHVFQVLAAQLAQFGISLDEIAITES